MSIYGEQPTNTFDSPNRLPLKGILWSCICRNDTILCEAGEDNTEDESVTKAAQELLKKRDTPGWEFHCNRKTKLKSMKFHVYDKDATTKELFIWKFACVYDDTIEKDQSMSFLEKIVILTENQRAHDFDWQHGGVLAAQEAFASILLQRMQEVAYMGRMAMVNSQVDEVKEIMGKNIDMILENQEPLSELNDEATKLQQASLVFKKRSQQLKRFKMWQNAKHGVVVGTAITAGVAVVTVPPLIALL